MGWPDRRASGPATAAGPRHRPRAQIAGLLQQIDLAGDSTHPHRETDPTGHRNSDTHVLREVAHAARHRCPLHRPADVWRSRASRCTDSNVASVRGYVGTAKRRASFMLSFTALTDDMPAAYNAVPADSITQSENVPAGLGQQNEPDTVEQESRRHGHRAQCPAGGPAADRLPWRKFLPFGADDPRRDRDEADEHDTQHPTERGDIEPRRADPRDDDCREGQEQADGDARRHDHSKMRVRLSRGRSDSRLLPSMAKPKTVLHQNAAMLSATASTTEQDHPADRDLSKRDAPAACAP